MYYNKVMNQKIKDREMSKYYLCVVQGRMEPREGKLEGYLFKDEVKKQVYVRGRPGPGAKTAVTLYKTLAVKNGLSLVEYSKFYFLLYRKPKKNLQLIFLLKSELLFL